MQHNEYELQKSVARYLCYQYPDVVFLSDTIASIKLTPSQANRNKLIQKNEFKCPDLLILEPTERYFGLFIELKIDSPFKKDGTIKASQNDHLLKQYESLLNLKSKGYYAAFSWSFDMTKELIDNYFNDKL
jgi:hypothetical protein